MLICACLWLVVSAMPVAQAQAQAQAQAAAEEERLLMAVFIYNFAKFTRWPENAWGGQGEPLRMCVAGKDDLADALERLGGKTIQGRQVTIESFTGVRFPRRCHVLYVAASERERPRDIIEFVRGEPVLTVSELPHFASSGGIIELYRDKGRIRFIINLGIARRAGLEFSSRLLDLAVVVNHDEAP